MRLTLTTGTQCRSSSEGFLGLRVLGRSICIRYDNNNIGHLLQGNFGSMARPTPDPSCSLEYRVQSDDCSFLLESRDSETIVASGQDELIYALEKEIVVALQRERPDLLFLHSAAVEWQGKAVLLAADSGCGKSTTTWALLHHGFRYLSDELAPIDPETLEVFSYPHALCLKQPPPAPYDLPDATMYLGRTTHVPVVAMPAPLAPSPLPVGAIFLVHYDAERSAPELRRLSAAEASARLYVTTLNALAHDNRGLPAIVDLAERVTCYSLTSADLAETCELIRNTLQ